MASRRGGPAPLAVALVCVVLVGCVIAVRVPFGQRQLHVGTELARPDTSDDQADEGIRPPGRDEVSSTPFEVGQPSASDETTRYTVPTSVSETAQSVLAEYRDSHVCVLVHAGYLDLFGTAWGCTVQGDGWVDLCEVCASEDGESSYVTIVRMDAFEWARDLDGKAR